MLSFASSKAKLFIEILSENCNLDDSGSFLFVSPSRTNMKLHNTHVTPNIAKKVMTDLNFSKASGPN